MQEKNKVVEFGEFLTREIGGYESAFHNALDRLKNQPSFRLNDLKEMSFAMGRVTAIKMTIEYTCQENRSESDLLKFTEQWSNHTPHEYDTNFEAHTSFRKKMSDICRAAHRFFR